MLLNHLIQETSCNLDASSCLLQDKIINVHHPRKVVKSVDKLSSMNDLTWLEWRSLTLT
jgi:hypothetical protein